MDAKKRIDRVANERRPILGSRQLVNRVVATLRRHPCFRTHSGDVAVHHEGAAIVLEGRVPSFYLKQVLQTAVRGIDGVGEVVDHVHVVNPGGLSSEPETSECEPAKVSSRTAMHN